MDYAKLKVTELKELLSARSLPLSGKKEELVARLIENDKSSNDLTDLLPPEEEYDWDTPANTPKTKTEVKAPVDTKPPTATERITTTETKTTPAPAETTVDSIAAELEKRKRRAERFGIPVNDNVKALERVKRFGSEASNGKVVSVNLGKKATGGKRILDDPAEAEKARKRTERFKAQ